MKRYPIITLLTSCLLAIYWWNANSPTWKLLNAKETLQTNNSTTKQKLLIANESLQTNNSTTKQKLLNAKETLQTNNSTTKQKLLIANESLQTKNHTYKLPNVSPIAIPPMARPNEDYQDFIHTNYQMVQAYIFHLCQQIMKSYRDSNGDCLQRSGICSTSCCLLLTQSVVTSKLLVS